MNTEELLKPRYKVVNIFPDMGEYKFVQGQILTIPSEGFLKVKLGVNCYPAFFDNYPHLFKKLEWWEERKESDMPEYVKYKKWLKSPFFEVYKVVKPYPTEHPDIPAFGLYHVSVEDRQKKGICVVENDIHTELLEIRYLRDFLPATKEEYEYQN